MMVEKSGLKNTVKKKIGLVLAGPPGYSETFFRSKIKGLQANGMEVILFCRNKGEFDLCKVVEQPTVTANPLKQLLFFIKEYLSLLPHLKTVKRYIKLEKNEGKSASQIAKSLYLNSHILKAKLDWLHFGFATMALGSETVAKAIGAKIAVSFRGYDIHIYPVKNPGCYSILWKYVDKIHTISMGLVESAKKKGMPITIPYEKITPAIDVEVFNSNTPRTYSREKSIFITTGRLHWIKGYVATIEALAILKAEGFDFVYKIIGEGREYERIAYAVHQLDLSENVEFLGQLSTSEVKAHLETADIYLQYSIQEGFCNAVLEAQAMGKLCIVSNAEGLTENVVHNQTGWVVPKYAPELLAERIKNVLLMSPEDKKTISENAVERVRTEFKIEKQQREFINFYKF